jgi:hypothetical protein
MRLGDTKEYRAWTDMRRRCNNPERPQYARYGGRGITVCDRWNTSFANFYADVGPAPSKEYILDRIDNDTGYEPGNVKWSSPRDSTNNRGVTRHVIIDGKQVPAEVAAEMLGCTGAALRSRLSSGDSPERAGRAPRKINVQHVVDGVSMTIPEWSKATGIHRSTLKWRIRNGFSMKEAISVRHKPNKEK